MTRPADRLRIAARSVQPDVAVRGRMLDHVVPACDRRPPADDRAPALKPVAVTEPDVDGVVSNIVIFPKGGASAESSAPTPEVAERPAPVASRMSRVGLSVLFVCLSLAAHGVTAGAFLLDKETPAASIGEEVITVEVVLGADTFAGLAEQASQSEAAPNLPDVKGEEEPEPKPEIEPEPVEKAEVTPHEPVKDGPPPAPEEPAAQTKPEREDKPTTSDAEALAVAVPQPRPDDAPVKDTKPAERKIERKPAKRTERKREAARPQASRASTAASSGVGRGSSTSIANYRGMVAAQLARHKTYPSTARARGEQGTAVVSFSVSGSGAVTGVRLVRGSGSESLDSVAQAMPSRASPFPPPPGGRPMSFTVPIGFRMR